VGRRCAFLRLGNCNLNCIWCDTAYTWDWSRFDKKTELIDKTPNELIQSVSALNVDLLVITGGEPLLQQRQLIFPIKELVNRGIEVEVETNGTIVPSDDFSAIVSRFNVSPKMHGSGVQQERRERSPAIRGLRDTGKANWKFVVTGPGDLDEVADFVNLYGVAPVYIMPEGTDWNDHIALARELSGSILDLGYNLTTRLHIALWGDKRGH
jgi:7-carboxy-7-deazaguanine synthase